MDNHGKLGASKSACETTWRLITSGQMREELEEAVSPKARKGVATVRRDATAWHVLEQKTGYRKDRMAHLNGTSDSSKATLGKGSMRALATFLMQLSRLF
jgi:hypothetical protein